MSAHPADDLAVVIPFRLKPASLPPRESQTGLRREFARLQAKQLARTGHIQPGYIPFLDWLRCYYDMKDSATLWVDTDTLRRVVQLMRYREDRAS